MKQLLVILVSSVYLVAMDTDNTGPEKKPTPQGKESASIETITKPTCIFDIKPNAIKIIPLELTFKTGDPHCDTHTNGCLDGFTGQYSIPTQNSTMPLVPPHTNFCFDPQDSPVWDNRMNDYHLTYEIKQNLLPERCPCNFMLSITPRAHNDHPYIVKTCADSLHVKYAQPLILRGLEDNQFKNFTDLTIQDCPHLSGIDGGALNTILTVMPNLTKLNLSGTKLDETVINAQHDKLEILYLKNCNCSVIKRMVMPQLLLLVLDYNPLQPINWKVVKISYYCGVSVKKS